MKKILIIAGGGKKHLEPFGVEAKKLGLNLDLASFSDLNYGAKGESLALFVGESPVSDFDLIYIRLVGKRFEDLALLLNEAKKRQIRVIDTFFEKSGHARLPLSKLLEIKLLAEAGFLTPKTLYGRLSFLEKEAPRVFGYPFVIKSTTGKQGHEVWLVEDKEKLDKLLKLLGYKEKEGKRFFAQEFIKAPKRIRVLVIGDQAVGAIVRPTKWRKRFSKVEVEKKALVPVPAKISQLAIAAAKTLMIDIAGVDILDAGPETSSGQKKYFVLEVNSAPRWEAVKKDCGVNVEREILEYLISL